MMHCHGQSPEKAARRGIDNIRPADKTTTNRKTRGV
jgi:hypothetical protein